MCEEKKKTDLQEAQRLLEWLRSYTSSGYKDLDALSGGLVRGGVTLIGSRPAMGSTSLVLNIVNRLSKQQSGNILIFSPAHYTREVAVRLLNIEMDLEAGRLLDGSLSTEEVAKRCGDFFLSRKSNIKIDSSTSGETGTVTLNWHYDTGLFTENTMLK